MIDLFHMPRILELRTQQQADELRAAAAADNHTIIGATHVVVKDGKIVGYGSIGGIPMVNIWISSKDTHARGNFSLLNSAECIAAGTLHCRQILMPCAESSPFFSLMPSLGYEPLGKTVLHHKTL